MALLKIADFDIYRFSIPFVRPVKVGSVLLDHRTGFLIALTDDKGRQGFGEVAPLPGLDLVDLEQCRTDLSLIRRTFTGSVFNPDHFDLTAPGLGMMSLPAPLSPHSLFGLESALLGLYLQNSPTVLPDTIRIPVNGLLIPADDDQQTDAQIAALQQSGMKTVKVKIGRLPADREIRQILRLTETMGQDLRLRLDGNRSLTGTAYRHYFSALKHLNIEYAEEPLREEDSLSDIPWAMALDESLPRYLAPSDPDPARLPPGIGTVILKPGLLPGLSGMASFIASARNRNIQTVLSSSFNTSVSIATLSLFAQPAGLPADTACGFDTLRYLQEDVLSHFPPVSGGMLTIPKNLFADMHLNFRVLSKEVL